MRRDLGVVAWCKLVEQETTRRGHYIDNARRYPKHTHAVFRCRFRGSGQDGEKELGQEEGPETIGADVGFVALGAHGAGGDVGDASVVPEDVEAGFLGEEVGDAGWDCAEIAEVEDETFDMARTSCVVMGGLYSLDCGVYFVCVTACHVDCAAFGVEDFDNLIPDA